MSVFETEALTLRTYPYSESHKIVVFLTRVHGKLRAIAYGAKKGTRNRYGGSLEPLTHVLLTFARNENQELAVVREVEIIQAHPAYQLSFEANLHFGYFAELLQEVANEEEDSENLFRLALAVLGQIDKKPILLLARYFELWILRLEGVLPALEERLPGDLGSRTSQLLREHPEKLDPEALNPAELKRLARFAEVLLDRHLEKRLKTRSVLDDLLG